MEKEFDEVAEGEKEWTGMMDSFYKGFHPLVDKTIHSKTEHKVGERVLGTDPVSGKPVSVKIGRFGPVIQIGTADDEEKPRFAQFGKGIVYGNHYVGRSVGCVQASPYVGGL